MSQSSKKAARELRKKIVNAYLEEHPCRDCGFVDPRALDFHHRDADLKSASISHMVSSTYPVEKIYEEMEKCDILCANCHRIHHAEERGWVIDAARLEAMRERHRRSPVALPRRR